MKHLLSIAVIGLTFTLPQLTAAQEKSRYPEIRPEQFSPEQKAFADSVQRSPRTSNVNGGPFQVYLRSLEFGRHAVAMSDYLRWGTSLEPRLSELAILIAARNWSSSYIWHSHYPLAIKGGLDPAIPAAMAAGQRPRGMKADEEIIYNFLTQIYRDKSVSDAAFNAAVARYGEKGVTDIIGLASYYGITAMSLIAARAPVAPGDEPKLQAMAQVFPK